MILLEVNNRVIYETLKVKFSAAKPESVNVTAVDFDGVRYQISNPDVSNKSVILLSAKMRMYEDLVEFGVDEELKNVYGDFVTTAEDGWNVSLKFDLATMTGDKDEIALRASYLKRNCFAAAFQTYFKMQESGTSSDKTAVIHYHEDEKLYISAQEDRVTVIFSTLFKDPDDIIIGKVFLQEFKDGRKGCQNAPQVLFSYGEPPRELEGFSGVLRGENVGFVTFVLYDRHTSAANRENTINLIHQFRTYLHYHIKCSKAYLHQRMRSKTTEFLKVLNRAKPEAMTEKKFGKRA